MDKILINKTVSGLERPEAIPKGNRREEENASDFDENDSDPSEVSADGSRN